MSPIRKACQEDAGRVAEIEVFNYRLNFYPIFQSDAFYFGEMQVLRWMQDSEETLDATYVYDDGVVKGFVRLEGKEIKKLFVEPVLQGRGIGAALLAFVIAEKGADNLWALEKNARAIAFYQRHGFYLTGERKPEEGTSEYLVRMERK